MDTGITYAVLNRVLYDADPKKYTEWYKRVKAIEPLHWCERLLRQQFHQWYGGAYNPIAYTWYVTILWRKLYDD